MSLLEIQKLQFNDKQTAEQMMLSFLKQNEDPQIEAVELTPRPQSLNSINGFLSYNNGEKLFFKTHVEENEQLSEYYNASTLSKAGYPVISAKQITHRPGKQIALYEIVSFPTLFDLLKEEEDNLRRTNQQTDRAAMLLRAQTDLDKAVFKIYENTLTTISASDNAEAPIHQLFFHRLAEDGRIGLFYRGKPLKLDDREIAFEQLEKMRWRINGVDYSDTIEQIIKRCRINLKPSDEPAIIGHGDAHNGNLFVDLDAGSLHMFDPAFAGKHDPLLDLVKPTFHNVFARWMYYPEQVQSEFDLSYEITGDRIEIKHTFLPSSLRLAYLQARKENLIRPTLRLLKKRDLLPDNWREFLHSALFCCPFLTVNLLAKHVPDGALAERYELPIKLLGLSMAVMFGSMAHTGNDKLSEIIDDLFVY